MTITEDLWYKNAIIYSLDLETFMDANGDGVGDFEGLSRRLEYLHALGVDAIWLAPFQPTPNKDNGYDIKDYYSVDPRLGTIGEFVSFMHNAQKMGIKIIMDLVINHTSDQHPWFKNARSSKDALLRDWYIWSDKRPANWNKGMVFPGVQKSTWTLDKKTNTYYHHRFYQHQPDLNMENPAVREEISRIMGFWLQLGVSGFRVDAVPFILEASEPGVPEPEKRFEYLREMRRFVQWRKGNAVLLGEANVLPEETKDYFGNEGNGIHLMFNFYVNQYAFYTMATGDAQPLINALEATRVSFPLNQWAQFLRNHDELDLGRLTDEERQKVFEKFGPDKNMQLYERGIRRRLGPMLGSRQQSELAYSLMFSLPGTPVIRYGDEIGMGDNLSLKERAAVRTPMQWSGDEGAGFSKAGRLVHPLVSKGFFSFKHVNVEDQRRDPSSMLNWMTAMIRLRKECPEIGWGDWQVLHSGHKEVLVLKFEWKGGRVMTVHNFDNKPHEVILKEKAVGDKRLIDLLNNEESITADGEHCINLDAYGYRWFRIGSFDHFAG